MRSLKIMLFGMVLFSSLQTLSAQVKFRLSLLPDQQTAVVSIYAENTWQVPLNAIGSAQVVLQIPTDLPFLAGMVTSFVPGTTWSDNAYIDAQETVSNLNFVCFALNERGTKLIPMQAGQEVPLFSFVNVLGHCMNGIKLAENDDPVVQAVVQQNHLNITQNFTVLGARGNAFKGILSDPVVCLTTQVTDYKWTVQNLKVFPNPVSDRLNIAWTSAGDRDVETLIVTDILGKNVSVQKIAPGQGSRVLEMDVSGWASGLYSAAMIGENGKTHFFHFIVSKN